MSSRDDRVRGRGSNRGKGKPPAIVDQKEKRKNKSEKLDSPKADIDREPDSPWSVANFQTYWTKELLTTQLFTKASASLQSKDANKLDIEEDVKESM